MRTILYLLLSLFALVASQNDGVSYRDVIEKTVTIIHSCTHVRSRNILLLGGEYNEFLERRVFDNVSVALVEQFKKTAFEKFTLTRYSFTMYQNYRIPRLLRKLERFIVIASSQPALRLLLQRIKDSPWANAEGFYIIIDRKTEERGCINAYHFLWTAWEYDLISSVFICIDPAEGLVLFIYDPYSDKAPEIWKRAERFKGRNGHPWLLLKSKYVDGPQLCDGFNYDKTANVDGYQIRLNAIAVVPLLGIDPSKPGLDKFTGDNGEVMKILLNKLNVSVYVIVYNGSADQLGGVENHGSMMGMMADVSNEIVDMEMNVSPLFTTWKIRYTYPHSEGGLCVITQPKGKISEFKRITSFMSQDVAIMVSVLSFVTLLVLTKHNGFIPAWLNVIRLTTSVSMLRLPEMNAIRIYLANVLMLFLIVNSVFQSHWSSLLTVPVSQPNIQNAVDLKKSGYAIYGSKNLEGVLMDPVLESNFHVVSYEECKNNVLKSKRAACLGDCLHLFERIRNDNLHHSKKIREVIHVYATRENWPLLGRVNKIIRQTVEAGVPLMWRRHNVRKIFWERRRKRTRDSSDFRVLTLKNLKFSFLLLAAGYACAIIIFILELLIGRYESWKGKREIRRW